MDKCCDTTEYFKFITFPMTFPTKMGKVDYKISIFAKEYTLYELNKSEHQKVSNKSTSQKIISPYKLYCVLSFYKLTSP